MVNQSQMDRFYSKVNKLNSGCWEWKGTMRGKYGIFSYQRKTYTAHRWFYEVIKNIKIPREIFACHKCDNPKCVNPDHIFLGTHQDNMRDAYAKKRMWGQKHHDLSIIRAKKMGLIYRGENHGLSKLTEDQVVSIFEMRKSMSSRKIGKQLGVCESNIRSIVKGLSWQSDRVVKARNEYIQYEQFKKENV